MKKLYFLLIISALFCGCYKVVEVDYFYADYSRIAGPDGDTLYFFANYQSDTGMISSDYEYFEIDDRMAFDSSHILMKLEVPAGALDSELVFNFYQYQDYEVANDLSQGYANVGCKFFYFVPVYYNLGYHEHDEADLSFHESFDFNIPIKVTYYFASDKNISTVNDKKLQLEFYDNLNPNYKLYRIKIPRVDEWGANRNIFVEWNNQGYPIGFNTADLNDIILGYWYQNSDNYVDDISLVNWELVENFEVDVRNQSVTFEIENSDYIYVLANVMQIDNQRIPFKIKNFIEQNYTEEILRASFDDEYFIIYLEDNSVLYFYKNGDFAYSNIDNITVPQYIRDYISTNFPNENIIANKLVKQTGNFYLYLNTRTKVISFYGQTLDSLFYTGHSNYTNQSSVLPQNILLYINQNYQYPLIQNIYTSNNGNVVNNYEVYISSEHKHIKLTFDANGNLSNSVYYGLKINEIEFVIFDTLASYFAGVDIASITKQIIGDSSVYTIKLINEANFVIKYNGEVQQADFAVLPQNLPNAVQNKMHSYGSHGITESSFHKDILLNPSEYYLIECFEGLFVSITPSGEVNFASSNYFLDLPQNIRNYITTNYSEDAFSDFYYGYYEYNTVEQYIYYVYLTNNTVLVFNASGSFLGTSNKAVEIKTLKENFKAKFAD